MNYSSTEDGYTKLGIGERSRNEWFAFVVNFLKLFKTKIIRILEFVTMKAPINMEKKLNLMILVNHSTVKKFVELHGAEDMFNATRNKNPIHLIEYG